MSATIKGICNYIISFHCHEWTQRQTGSSDTESTFQYESMQPRAATLLNQAWAVVMSQHYQSQDNMQVMEVLTFFKFQLQEYWFHSQQTISCTAYRSQTYPVSLSCCKIPSSKWLIKSVRISVAFDSIRAPVSIHTTRTAWATATYAGL
jgi:hypothetical protein